MTRRLIEPLSRTFRMWRSVRAVTGPYPKDDSEKTICRTEDLGEAMSAGELQLAPEEEEQSTPLEPTQRKVICEPKDQSIYELHRQSTKGNLRLDPEFQRFRVWDDIRSSRLIESVLLDVPIPTIFLAEEEDGSYSVIDGQQRLGAFFDFLDNKLVLKKLSM